jgi:hypothetical protein
MTTLAPTTQLPEPFAFDNETAPLRSTTPLLSPREEARLQLLASEIVRYAPQLTLQLRNRGMTRLRAAFIEA